MQSVEKVVEVPQVQTFEKVVPVPHVSVQDVVALVFLAMVLSVVRLAPGPQFPIVVKVVVVPLVQVVAQVVAIPQVLVLENVFLVPLTVVQVVVWQVLRVLVLEGVKQVPKIRVQEVGERVAAHCRGPFFVGGASARLQCQQGSMAIATWLLRRGLLPGLIFACSVLTPGQSTARPSVLFPNRNFTVSVIRLHPYQLCTGLAFELVRDGGFCLPLLLGLFHAGAGDARHTSFRPCLNWLGNLLCLKWEPGCGFIVLVTKLCSSQ